MGLDMYLIARRRVYPWIEKMKPVHTKMASAVKEFLNPPESAWDDSGITVSIEVGYWRKANAIHGWMVKNIQDGRDECQESYLTKEKAQELLSLCQTVLNDPSKASNLLPPTPGFFFGSLEPDEFYLQDLQNTCRIMENILADKTESWEYYYQASW